MAQVLPVSGYPVAWGEDSLGELGVDSCCDPLPLPAPVSGLAGIVAVSAAGNHSLALRSDGTVWAWGCCGESAGYPQLHARPVQVRGLTSVVAIAAGSYHGLALRQDGTVWSWGFNAYGQLGTGSSANSSTPVQVVGLTSVVKIAALEWGSLALRSDGTVWEWGSYPGGASQLPRQVSGLRGMLTIAAAADHVLAIGSDGTVWSLGDDGHGHETLPARVKGSHGVGVLNGIVGIAAGYRYSLAVRRDGTVWTWGTGLLGLGGNAGRGPDTSQFPIQIPGFSKMVAVVASGAPADGRSLALRQDGTVWAWGVNNAGQLGIGAVTRNACRCVNAPVQLRGLRAVVAIAAAGEHTLAVSLSRPSAPRLPLCAESPGTTSAKRFPRTISLHGPPDALSVSEQRGHVFVLVHSAIGCTSGVLMLDAATGSPLGSVPAGINPTGLAVDDLAGRALVVNSGNQGNDLQGSVSLIDARIGHLLHTAAVGWAPAAIGVDERTWRAFVVNAGQPDPPNTGKTVSVLAVTRGIVLRTIPGGSSVGPLAVAVDEQTGRVFVPVGGGVLMLDAADGHPLRTLSLASQESATDLAVDQGTGRLFAVGTVYCWSDRFSEYDATVVHVFDAATGAALRTVNSGCHLTRGDLAPTLVVDEPLGRVVVLQSMWTAGSWGGMVLDAHDGRVVRPLSRVADGDTPGASAVDGRTGTLYLAGVLRGGGAHVPPGVVLQLDPRSWRIVRTFALPGRPAAIVLAERARRLFVTNRDTNAVTVFQL